MIMDEKGISADDMNLKIKSRYGMETMVDHQQVTAYIQNGVQKSNEVIHLTMRLCGKGGGGEDKAKGSYFGKHKSVKPLRKRMDVSISTTDEPSAACSVSD